MKKLLRYAIMSAATLTLATSCSQEEIQPVQGDGNVTFAVQLPTGIGTRAFGDGQSAQKLIYAVYQVEGEGDAATYKPVGTPDDSKTFSNLQTTVNLKLVNGKTYTIVFWAQNDACEAFSPDWDNRTVSIDYTKLTRNSEASDAFYATETFTVSGAVNKTVTLYRPFAQLNVGTNDLDSDAVNVAFDGKLTTTLTVEDVYSSFDFISGEPTGTPASVEFTATSTPEDEAFPVTGYQYLSMDYLLVPAAQSEIVNLTYKINADGTELNSLSIPNVPVQANYRTNIYGQLLTSDADINVVIEPTFETPDYIYDLVWDGTTTEAPVEDAEGNLTVNNAAQLAGLRDAVKNGNTLEGKTVTLTNDLDMNGQRWTSMGTSTNPFKGTFDGQGHAVRGLKSALFSYIEDANVQNLTVRAEGTMTAALTTYTKGDCVISNVKSEGVIKPTFTIQIGSGGLVSNADGNSLTIENCENHATVIDPSYCGGGLVGRSKVPLTITGCKNYGNISSKRSSEGKAAGFVGMPSATTTIKDSYNYGNIEVNTQKQGAAGGFIAWVNTTVTLENCVNEGTVTLNLTNSGSMSVIGGLYGGNGYGTGPKTFTNCTNNGAVNVNVNGVTTTTAAYQYGIYAGGIMGSTSYDDTTVENCTSNAPITVTTTGENPQMQYIGALVGGLGWETGITIKGNSITDACVLTGNQGENTLKAALFVDMAPGNNKNVVTENNTNSTSYPATTSK